MAKTLIISASAEADNYADEHKRPSEIIFCLRSDPICGKLVIAYNHSCFSGIDNCSE